MATYNAPTYQQAQLKGLDELSGMYGVDYDANKIYDVFKKGVDAGNQVAQDQYKIAENQFSDQMGTARQDALGMIRKNNAKAVATGASKGMQAANELSTVLGLTQQGVSGATTLAQQKQQLADQYSANLATANQQAYTTANQNKLQLAGLGTSLYNTDTTANVGRYTADSNAAGARYTADTQSESARYAADQQLKGMQAQAEATAEYNRAYAEAMAGKNSTASSAPQLAAQLDVIMGGDGTANAKMGKAIATIMQANPNMSYEDAQKWFKNTYPTTKKPSTSSTSSAPVYNPPHIISPQINASNYMQYSTSPGDLATKLKSK